MNAAYPRVLAVGDRAVTVEVGGQLDEETVARVRALDVRLRERSLRGIREAVPTYASLLVIFDRAVISFADLSAELLRLAQDLSAEKTEGRHVEVPTVYDGEDLDDVAKACSLSRDSIVEIHSSRTYAALMLGFSPGFAYLGFLDERLRLPRRKTPRTRVPAGSVAIAGPQTGIYPRSLPGGWNLVGRTTETLFDPSHEQPSLLMPGDRIRFVPATALKSPRAAATTRYDGHDIEVREAGLLTTIQDAGRRGLRRVAVPWTGYADPGAAARANVAAGNRADAPLIEICGPGLTLVFQKTTFVAIGGARITAELERSDLDGGRLPVPMNVALRVRPGNLLTITGLSDGTRGYVAIAGLSAPQVLGSASVDLSSNLLRPLVAGDRLSIGGFDGDRPRRDPVTAPRPRASVRVVLGPQLQHFDDGTISTFLTASWRVGLDSDRVGARLDGPRLTHAGASEIVSDGMIPGCVQVPPDGRPIVMLSDCPTTGGYPKVACVVSEDLGRLAQAVPGQTEFRFTRVRAEDLQAEASRPS